MKLKLFLLALTALTLSTRSQEPDQAAGGIITIARETAIKLLDDVSSYGGLSFQLAAERYAANTNKNEKWILTVHNGRRIQKFTDKNYIVVSLPVIEPRDKLALCQYATSYNAFSERACDLMVKAGKYKEPKELYRLLIHFDCGVLKERYEQKLDYVGKLERKEDVEENLKKFMELSNDLFTRVDFSQMEKATPTVVTNLLELRLP